jgi:hypothetical protein
VERLCALENKIHRHLCSTPPLDQLSVGGWGNFGLCAVFAAAIMGLPLARYYVLLKVIGRWLSALNRGVVGMDDSARLSGRGEREEGAF